MTWYNTPARIESLEAAARFWIGTPFRANSAVVGPGGVVSCHNLVAELYFLSGYLTRFLVPTGDPRSLVHGHPDAMLTRFEAVIGSRFFSVDIPEPGDTLFLRHGRTVHHLAVMLTAGRCVHVLRSSGVIITPLEAILSSTRRDISIAAIRRPLL
jgi:hypothetical protein